MYNIQKKFPLKIFIVTITLLLMNSIIPNDTLAIRFFDGIPTVIVDINDPTEDFFGGSNSGTGLTQIDSTNLTVTTQNLDLNRLRSIFGGGAAGVGETNTIMGDSNLIVNNTLAMNLTGGSLSGGTTYILGSVNLTATNSTFINSIIGGCMQSPGTAGVSKIFGSINMNLDHILTRYVSGLGDTPGFGADPIAVVGDINITIDQSQITAIEIGGTNNNITVGGNATLNITNSNVTTIGATVDGNILGNVIMNIGSGTHVRDIGLTVIGTIFGESHINLSGSRVEGEVYLGPYGTGSLGPVFVTVKDGAVINSITCGPGPHNGQLNFGSVNVHNGYVHALQLGGDNAHTEHAVANIYQDGSVGAIGLGLTPGSYGEVTLAEVNISSGANVYLIATGANIGSSHINFIDGKGPASTVKDGILSLINSPPDVVNIQKGAVTQWGNKENTFNLITKNLILSGKLLILQENKNLELTVLENLTINNGTIALSKLVPTTGPLLNLIGTPQSKLTIQSPLTVQLIASPALLKSPTKKVPFTKVTKEFANPALFTKYNTKSLIWSESIFDSSDNTWYLTNFKPSEDYYAFSAAREASNWLRQQHIWSLQRRSTQVLKNDDNGLWINFQGGHEKLDATIGEAKMPWVMASMGYDYLHIAEQVNLKALYGFGIGVAKGNNKWNTINSAKNDISEGILAGYVGVKHNSGIYGAVTLQFAVSHITTQSTGFETNHKWNESVPTQAIELGWQHTFNNGLTLNPRGQFIVEHLEKTHFSIPYENDVATLSKGTVSTTIIGLAGNYDVDLGVPVDVQASVDWIKGVSGDFAAKSFILQMNFKDKNDSSVIRSSLGFNTQLKENFSLQCNVFADAGNDKGFGGQLSATYRF